MLLQLLQSVLVRPNHNNGVRFSRETTLVVAILVVINSASTIPSSVRAFTTATQSSLRNVRIRQAQRQPLSSCSTATTATFRKIRNTDHQIATTTKHGLSRTTPEDTIRTRRTVHLSLSSNEDNNNDENNEGNDIVASPNRVPVVWNPNVRKVMGGLATFGALETIYLTTLSKGGSLNDDALPFCSSSVSFCNSVLSSPYAQIPGTDVPLSAVGAIAYLLVFGLAVTPLLQQPPPPLTTPTSTNPFVVVNDDSINRLLLLATTTTMGVFSIYLISILFIVLHQSCLYCLASASCSIGLMTLAWCGGALPPDQLQKQGLSLSFGGGLVATVAALFLVGTNDPNINTAGSTIYAATATNSGSITSTLLTSTESLKKTLPTIVVSQESPPLLVDQIPPDITTESSSTAMQLATDLQTLEAKFYGAYWCSHCYDQKQAFGKQAMQRIPYVECSREGKNEQAKLCKERKIPGYPTWEISGKLYPGERALDELREIVVSSMKK